MTNGTALAAHPVSTTDVLKLVGVLAFLVDHYGFFFDPGENGWRLFGRVASPIFFFLIGFARTRRVPWIWLAFGTALTAFDALTWAGLDRLTLNILLNFALLRVLVLPVVEAAILPRPWAMAALVLICLPLIPLTDYVLEYGTGGWLWAFFGLAHRVALQEPNPRTAWTRSALGTVAAVAYITREIHDYRFDLAQSALLAAMIVVLAFCLARFHRTLLPWQPPQPLAAIMRFCGRSSLEIYAITLFLMQALAYAIATSNGGAP